MNDLKETAPESPAPLEIRLDQFMQLCGVATGGQAKILIQSGQVLLNGEVETRRRKKLSIGDEVVFDGEVFEVAFEANEDSTDDATDDAADDAADDVTKGSADENNVSETQPPEDVAQ